MSYSPTWVVFQPNIIVDARNGQLFTVNLKVKRYAFMQNMWLRGDVLHDENKANINDSKSCSNNMHFLDSLGIFFTASKYN